MPTRCGCQGAGVLPPMCRGQASFVPAEALSRIFGTCDPLPNVEATWNRAPTQPATVVRCHPETGERHHRLLTWGLLPTGLTNRYRP